MAKNATLGNSLVDRLTLTIDKLRKLNERFGSRTWTVTIVKRVWSGGERDSGTPTIISELVLDPTPYVKEIDAIANHRDVRLPPGGQDPQARILMTEVSLAYTEGQLTGKPTLVNEEVYYRFTDANGAKMNPTYYVLEGEPRPDRERTMGWVMKLSRIEIQE